MNFCCTDQSTGQWTHGDPESGRNVHARLIQECALATVVRDFARRSRLCPPPCGSAAEFRTGCSRACAAPDKQLCARAKAWLGFPACSGEVLVSVRSASPKRGGGCFGAAQGASFRGDYEFACLFATDTFFLGVGAPVRFRCTNFRVRSTPVGTMRLGVAAIGPCLGFSRNLKAVAAPSESGRLLFSSWNNSCPLPVLITRAGEVCARP
jgi:hypothetical protein